MATIAVALTTGCAQQQRHHSYDARFQHATSSIVLATAVTEAFDDEHFGWETSRRDRDLGHPGSASARSVSVAEIRHREFLRITNGRPRNDSFTSSRTFERRVAP